MARKIKYLVPVPVDHLRHVEPRQEGDGDQVAEPWISHK